MAIDLQKLQQAMDDFLDYPNFAANFERWLESRKSNLSQQAAISSSGNCSRCHTNDAADEHTCPYATEINGDYESLCDCCDDCKNECCMDI